MSKSEKNDARIERERELYGGQVIREIETWHQMIIPTTAETLEHDVKAVLSIPRSKHRNTYCVRTCGPSKRGLPEGFWTNDPEKLMELAIKCLALSSRGSIEIWLGM